MLYKQRGWYLLLVQNVEAEPYQVFSVALRKIGDRTNKARVWLAKFQPALRRSILAHHDTAFVPPCFLESAQGAEGAGIVDGADRILFRTRST